MGGFFLDFEAVRTESRDRDAPRRHLAVAYSDHLTGVAAFDEWRQQKKSRNEFRWARANFCGGQTLKAIDQSRDQFARHLQSIGFIGKGNKCLREALNGTADLLPDSQSGSKNASEANDLIKIPPKSTYTCTMYIYIRAHTHEDQANHVRSCGIFDFKPISAKNTFACELTGDVITQVLIMAQWLRGFLCPLVEVFSETASILRISL